MHRAPPPSPRPGSARGARFPVGAVALVLLGLGGSGCDPVLNVYGSFFPAWVLALGVGIVGTVLLRLVLAATGVERHLAPVLLVYPSLTFLLTCVTWLVLFRQ